jgi:hypothetical protein
MVGADSFRARLIRKALFSAANKKEEHSHSQWSMDIDIPSSFFNRASWLSCALEDTATTFGYSKLSTSGCQVGGQNTCLVYDASIIPV